MKYKVKRASAGLGLFAIEPYKKGEFVIEYTGELISADEADERGGRYLFTINDDLVIDGKGREHKARYINHSCKPNCYAEVDEEKKQILIYTRKKIEPGEEFVYDYGKEYFKDYIKPHGCRCTKCVKKRLKKEKAKAKAAAKARAKAQAEADARAGAKAPAA